MRGVGTAAAVSVVGVGSMGTAAAEVGLDYDADLTPETILRSTAEVEVDLDDEPEDLDMIDEDGDMFSLSDSGYSLRESDDDEPHNPVGADLPEVELDEDEDDPLVVREVEDEDGDIETEEVFDHEGGDLWFRSLDDLNVDELLDLDEDENPEVEDDELTVYYEVDQLSRDLDVLDADYHFTERLDLDEDEHEDEIDDSVSGKTTRLRAVANHQLLDDESVEWDDHYLVFDGVPEDSDERYEVAGFSPDESSPTLRTDDALDLNLSSIIDDITSDDEDENRHVAEIEELATGDFVVSVIDIGLDDEEIDDIQESSPLFGGSGGTGSSFIEGTRGVILGLAGLAGAFIAWVRSRAPGV